ncbi:MAG TPA: M24 family metallopeptidase [Pyrinomonadaceae bacterium]|nr:M24 family metallopeptidase [Pyrinomonadaceae bacterium]
MRRRLLSTAAVIFFALALAPHARARQAQQTPAERVAEIQSALRAARLDGWLFYDFRRSDPLAYRILKLGDTGITTRRWFYYVPASGEPTKIVHSIERGKLDALPGRRVVYRRWQELHAAVRAAVARRAAAGRPRRATIAMQYSPTNDIPYVSRVDAGTIELVRSFGANITTSADLVQRFEAVWTPEQKRTHDEAAAKIHQIILDSFREIARRVRAGEPTTEYDIQQFMVRRYEEEGLTSDNDPPNVSVGPNSANPHYQPDARTHSPIRRGDFVLFDVWAKLKRPGAIYADQTWVGYVGETVPDEHARVFRIVREARDAAAEFVRASVRAGRQIRAADVDDVSRGHIERAGFGEQFTHRTGHSIGEEVHGNGAHIDNLETRDSRRIIAGTGFSIEPGVYLEGRFGVRSEINVYVSARDIEVTGRPVQTEVVAILATP